MKTRQVIKSMVFMLAIAFMAPSVFAQINQKAKVDKLQKDKVDKIQKTDVVGKPQFDRYGNPVKPIKPGSNSNSTDKSELQKKWMETNCGKQPYGDFYNLTADPCPSGYRKPTLEECQDLLQNYEGVLDKTTDDNPGKVIGVWYGASREDVKQATAADTKGCIFFPCSGRLSVQDNKTIDKNTSGFYASSYKSDGLVYFLWPDRNQMSAFSEGKTKMTVRCVKR